MPSGFKVNLSKAPACFVGWRLYCPLEGAYTNRTKFVKNFLAAQNILRIKAALAPFGLAVDTFSR